MKMDTEADYQRFYHKTRNLPGQIERTLAKLARLTDEARRHAVKVPSTHRVDEQWEVEIRRARIEGQARAEARNG